jgi:mediator of RNA polymerase II transcription subunit 17
VPVLAPPAFRQLAIGNMASYESTSDAIVFPHRRRTRLAISIRHQDSEGKLTISTNCIKANDSPALGDSLKISQQEVVEQEIFSVLVKEAGTLPTASARVSERLIVIDAAQGMELRFELVRAS